MEQMEAITPIWMPKLLNAYLKLEFIKSLTGSIVFLLHIELIFVFLIYSSNSWNFSEYICFSFSLYLCKIIFPILKFQTQWSPWDFSIKCDGEKPMTMAFCSEILIPTLVLEVGMWPWPIASPPCMPKHAMSRTFLAWGCMTAASRKWSACLLGA